MVCISANLYFFENLARKVKDVLNEAEAVAFIFVRTSRFSTAGNTL
jgi:hypothetical protein